MELDAQAMMRELQEQLRIVSMRAAEYAGMVDVLNKQLEAERKPKTELKGVV